MNLKLDWWDAGYSKTMPQTRSFRVLIAFAIGCSFTFEHLLIKHGFSIDHINNNKVVSMYKTNIKNISSGPFGNSMVVGSLLVLLARTISSNFSANFYLI